MKLHKKKVILLVIEIPITFFLFMINTAWAFYNEEVIFFEDFENYTIGSFPSVGGWELVWDGKGAQYQYITNASFYSPTKSFHLLGQTGWSSVVQRKFSTDAPVIGYEFTIFFENKANDYQDHPAFFKKGAEGQAWGTYYAAVLFDHKDGKIKAEDGTILGDWTPETWYKVRTILNRTSKTYSVWINEEQRGQNLKINMEHPELIDAIALTSAWPGVEVYYDDVKIFILEEHPLLIILSSVESIIANQQLEIFATTFYNNTTLTNLTITDFELFLNENPLPILNFTNFNNGTYELLSLANTLTLGTNVLKIQLTYNNLTFSNSTKIFVYNSTPFKQKILYITDSNWQNILSLVPLKRPAIISEEIDNTTINFINSYKPEQIFLLGNVKGDLESYESYRIASFNDVSPLFLSNESGIYASTKENTTAASLLAALLDKPLVFDEARASPQYNFKNKTREEIEEIYLKEIKKEGKNINYLVLADSNFSSLAALIASQPAPFRQSGFILETNTSVVENVLNALNHTIDRLNKEGFFINNVDYYLNGAYFLILGNIPPMVKEDPVEKQKYLGLIGFDDPEDGINFTTDLEYGDINNDTYLDIAVGRLPPDKKMASLMLARTLLPDSKKALVASEYLHTSWPVILLYAGGGMWHGRSIAKTLEAQNYTVTRFVEHRADPIDFFSSLAPVNAKSFLKQSEKIGKALGKILGKTIGSIISKVLIVIKTLQYAEQGLEMYLEYDWSTFGPKLESALEYLDSVAQALAEGENLTQEHALKLVSIFWPYPWADLGNKTALKEALPQHDIIYFLGIGNRSNWILPSTTPGADGFLGIGDFFKNNYNGSNYLAPADIPALNSRLVWDNANFGGLSEMRDKFLESGTASLIGASALNYNQFSAEIDSRFFKHEATIGSALIGAINDFRDDWLTYDPLNVLKPGIKAKTLREFILLGDPSLQKDPIIEPEKYVSNIICDNGICEQNITIPPTYELINTTNETTIYVDTEDHLLELFKPIIPLIEFEYYLPFSAAIISRNITASEINYTNITLPKLELLQYGINYTNETKSTEWYPENVSRLEINTMIDARTRIKLIHAAVRYNESSGDTRVYNEIRLNLRYLTPLEFSIATKNITLGEVEDVEVRIWSNISDNTTIYLQIQNSTTSETITCSKEIGKGHFNFTCPYTPKVAGTYLVKAILVKHDPLIVGPRESVFIVKEKEIPAYAPPPSPAPSPPTGFAVALAPKRNKTNVTIEREVSPEIKEIKKEVITPICGNGICERGETPESCPEDCAPKIEKKIAPTGPTGFFVLVAKSLFPILIAMAIIVAAILIFKVRF